jgi:hypothetical protein
MTEGGSGGNGAGTGGGSEGTIAADDGGAGGGIGVRTRAAQPAPSAMIVPRAIARFNMLAPAFYC